MNKNIEDLFFDLWRTIISYLPNLLAGLLLIAVGWLVGWFIKRIIIQLLVILRFEKLLGRLRWKNALSKADVRYAVYNMIGNVFFLVVFLIFLDSAFSAMNLIMLSKFIENSILFFPRIILAISIFGVGWLIAARASSSISRALIKENISHASMIGRFAKFMLIIFFSAILLVELNIAISIVTIGFTVVFVSVGVIAIILVAADNKVFKKYLNSDK